MKKYSRFVSIFALATMALVGCSKTEVSSSAKDSTTAKPSEQQATTPTPAPTERKKFVVACPSLQKDFIEAKVNAFLTSKGLSNSYTFTISNIGEGDVNNGTAVPDWTAETAPDLYAYASDQTLGLVSKGALAEVPSAYSTAMKTDMGDEVINAAKVGKKYYGYPYAGDNGYFLYYNKSIFNGKEDKLNSVDGIVEVCKANSVKFSYKLADTFFSTGLMFTFGARYDVTLSTDGKSIASISADFDTEKGMKAAKAMQSIINNADIDTTKDGQKAPTTANGLGATVDGSWNANTYKEAMGDNYACIKLPTVTVDGETKNIGSFLGYKLYGVNPSKGSDTTKLGMLHQLANYLVSEDVQKERFNQLTIAPTLKSVKSLAAVQNTPHIKAIAAQAEFSVAQTIVPNNIWTESTSPYTGIMNNKDATTEELQTLLNTYNTAVKNVA